MNEFLRRQGYLRSQVRRLKFLDYRFLIERLKTKILDLMFEYDMEDLVARLAKYVPGRKALKDSSFITNRDGSVAYTPDFAGRNPVGGIEINREELEKNNIAYEDFRTRLIQEISRIRDPRDNGEIVRWAVRREDLYSGRYIEKYPDVVFELAPEYGVSWDLHGRVVGVNPTHKKISGGHLSDGVLMVADARREVVKKQPDLLDLTPTVLDLLGLPLDDRYEGTSLLR
jgi:predicted AlkP superfamily phosphohydrolase/phosphomutase